MNQPFGPEQRRDLARRGFSRRDFGRIAALMTAGASLPFYNEAAMAQGPNRFARAQFYLARGQAEAAKLGVPCRWSRIVVPGVGHEGMRMSASAAQHWFDSAPA